MTPKRAMAYGRGDRVQVTLDGRKWDYATVAGRSPGNTIVKVRIDGDAETRRVWSIQNVGDIRKVLGAAHIHLCPECKGFSRCECRVEISRRTSEVAVVDAICGECSSRKEFLR